jgi:ankyrin repeat protein
VAAKVGGEEIWKELMDLAEVRGLVNDADHKGVTPLIASTFYLNMIGLRYLLRNKAKTTSRTKPMKQNALHFAATLPSSEPCAELLRANPSPSFLNSRDELGFTPLLLAVNAGSPAYLTLLNAGAEYRSVSKVSGRNVFHYAVVSKKWEVLGNLLHTFKEQDFIDERDINGDTPLMLAVRLEDVESVRLILEAPLSASLESYSHTTGQTSIHITILDDNVEILRLLLKKDRNQKYIDIRDKRGRTPILYAVELERADCVELLLEYYANFHLVEEGTGNTILHIASYIGNHHILNRLLAIDGIHSIINVENNRGYTAFDVAVEYSNPDTLWRFLDTELIDERYLNRNNETVLYLAAKKGNYNNLQFLLLSDEYRKKYYDKLYQNLKHLLHAEIKGDVFTSDIYILTGIRTTGRDWVKSPNKDFLFQHTSDGKNIFHACVLGQNIECLKFIYSYTKYFTDFIEQMDEQDREGTTPNLLSLQSGEGKMAKFLVQKGASIFKMDFKGRKPLDAMVKYVPEAPTLLYETLSECVTIDRATKGVYSTGTELEVSFKLLCPKGFKQMHVPALLYSELYPNKQFHAALSHPLIEYYILLKWARLRKLMDLRFLLNVCTVILFSIYVSMLLCPFLHVSSVTLDNVRYITQFLFVISLLVAIPCSYAKNKFGSLRQIATVNLIIGPIFSMVYLSMNSEDQKNRWALETGAVGMLSTWFSLLTYGYVTKLNKQIAMFNQVIGAVLSHIGVILIVLGGFSFSFFILFSQSFNFSNPFHSLLYTMIVMLEGDLETNPIFNKEAREEFGAWNVPVMELVDDGEAILKRPAENLAFEFHAIAVEGFFLLMFEILVMLCLLNMIVGLAVRGGTELEEEGELVFTRVLIAMVYEWENFLDSRLFKILSLYNFSWLLGVPKDLPERINIPMIAYPLRDAAEYNLDIHHIQNLAVQKKTESEDFRPFLRYSSEN